MVSGLTHGGWEGGGGGRAGLRGLMAVDSAVPKGAQDPRQVGQGSGSCS